MELLDWLKKDPLAVAKAKAELYRRQPLAWLFGSRELRAQAKTRDEHDPSIEAKPFPDKPYIREVVQFWQTHRMNIWEKSRQVMASWTLCALYLHDTQFGMNRLNAIQSKKEEDSDSLLRRCFFIWQHQEPWLRELYPAVYSYCHLRFYRSLDDELPHSEIFGCAQGEDVLRQHTCSGLLIDEAAFQPDLEKALGAAQPTIKGGGRIDLVSSAEPGYFQDLAEDRVK
jgi:hypothetical protein